MSEKRFYYNTFYFDDDDYEKEFEIRDREDDEWAIYINENGSNWEDMLVDRLNELDRKAKVENVVDNILFQTQEAIINNLKDLCCIQQETINKLRTELTTKQDTEIKRDINYWKGIEKAHIDLHDQYYDRIVELERENALLLMHIKELEDDEE